MVLSLPPGMIDLALRDALAGSIQNLDMYLSRPGKDFSRNRKLDITTMAAAIITMGEHGIRSELIYNPATHVKQLLEPVLIEHRPNNRPKCMPCRRPAATSSAFTLKRKLLILRYR